MARADHVLDEPFAGYQQRHSYRMRQDEDEAGEPVARIGARADGAARDPDFLTRRALSRPAPVELEGRAWSG